jgi:tetratricopeptide (TPR) repeat protein
MKIIKTLFIGVLIIIAFYIIFNFKRRESVNTQSDYIRQTVYNYRKDKKLADYVIANIDLFLANSISFDETVRQNICAIREATKIIQEFKKSEVLNKKRADRILFKLKHYNFTQVKRELEVLAFEKDDVKLVAEKQYLTGLINEIIFNNIDAIANYKKAINLSSKNAKYYNRLAMLYYKSNNLLKAKTLLETSLGLTQDNLKDNKQRIKTLYNLAEVYTKEGKSDKAVNYYNKAYFLARSNCGYGNKMYMWLSVVELGNISFQKGEYLEAIRFYQTAYKLSNKLWVRKLKAYSLLKLANANYHYGNYDQGLKYSKRALLISKKIYDVELQALAEYNVCLSLEYLNEKDKAKIYCEASVDNMNKLIGLITTPEFLIKLGDMTSFAASIRDYRKALENYQKAYDLIKKNNFEYQQILLLTKLGTAHRNLGNTQEAFKYFQMSDKLNARLRFDKPTTCNECNRAFAYTIIKENKNAIKSYIKAIEFALEDGNKATLSSLYGNLGLTYQKLGNTDKALEYLRKAIDINQQIYKNNHHYIRWSEDMYKMILKEEKVKEN